MQRCVLRVSNDNAICRDVWTWSLIPGHVKDKFYVCVFCNDPLNLFEWIWRQMSQTQPSVLAALNTFALFVI